jgi:hypothetical protein
MIFLEFDIVLQVIPYLILSRAIRYLNIPVGIYPLSLTILPKFIYRKVALIILLRSIDVVDTNLACVYPDHLIDLQK